MIKLVFLIFKNKFLLNKKGLTTLMVWLVIMAVTLLLVVLFLASISSSGNNQSSTLISFGKGLFGVSND